MARNTPPRPGYIKKYISGYIDLVTIDFKFHPTSCKTMVAVATKRRKLAQIWSYVIYATKKYFAPSGKRWKQMLWEIIGAIVLSKPKNTVVGK